MKGKILLGLLIGVVVWGLFATGKDDEEAIKNCTNQGYSKTVCEREFYGVY